MTCLPTRHALLVVAALLGPVSRVYAQAIGTSGIERETGRDAYWRIVYDNDFFTATDRYFTQGIVVENVRPSLGRIPLARLLLAPRGSVRRVGLAYEDDGYTASDLKRSAILSGDHPYAGTKQLRLFAIAVDTLRRRRIASSLNIGIIGQGAGGAEIQTFIHRQTGNTIPQGWHNQIRNDLILNYEASMERALLQPMKHLLIAGTGVVRLGTYNTAATMAATVMIGRVGTSFQIAPTAHRIFYAYARPQLNLVGYDATLQGGLFNRGSPYTIASGDLSRAVYRHQVGMVFRSGSRFLEYYQSLGSAEFRNARHHRSGGILFGFGH